MTPLYLIDTSVWIFTLGDHSIEPIRKRIGYLLEQNLASITSPILFELLSGTKGEALSNELKRYLLTLHPFPFIEEDWIKASDWTHSLRKRGVQVKTLDALIAYKAIRHDLTLVHSDRDFDRIAENSMLRVESYVEAVRDL